MKKIALTLLCVLAMTGTTVWAKDCPKKQTVCFEESTFCAVYDSACLRAMSSACPAEGLAYNFLSSSTNIEGLKEIRGQRAVPRVVAYAFTKQLGSLHPDLLMNSGVNVIATQGGYITMTVGTKGSKVLDCRWFSSAEEITKQFPGWKLYALIITA